jgi:quinol monooxygenase YgiN
VSARLVPLHEAELFEISEALHQHLVTERGDAGAQLGVTQGALFEVRQDDGLPFAAQNFQTELYRTSERALQAVSHYWRSPFGALRAGPRQLYMRGSIAHRARSALYPTEGKSMVVEYIRYEVPAERQAEFVQAYGAAAADLAQSSHCLRFEVAQGMEEPSHFIVRIEWDSVAGHEQGFRTSPEFSSFFAKVKPFFAQIREMKHYEVKTSGTGAAQPAI